MSKIFKSIWLLILLISLYTVIKISIALFFVEICLDNDFKFFNLIIPNLISCCLLVIYTYEIMLGYKSISKQRNYKSLVIYSLIIIMITLFQFHQFEYVINDINLENWCFIITCIAVITSYIGLLLNRILSIKNN